MSLFGLQSWNNKTLKHVALKLYLLACFLPISIGGITANYLFAGFFLFGRYRKGSQVHFVVPLFVLFCTLAYAWAFFFMSPVEGLTRQTFSFGVFFLGLCLVFVRLPYRIDDIIDVILIVTTLYSIWVIYTVINNPLFVLTNPNGIKMGMREFIPDWPQRYVILVMFASLCALHRALTNKYYFPIFFLLTACVFLSFTRSAYLALVLGIIGYVGIQLVNMKQQIRFKPRTILYFMGAFGALIFIVISNEDIQFAANLLITRTVEPITQFVTGQQLGDNSAATRLDYWEATLNVFSRSPLVGTGFGGIALYDDHIGSAHNQYLDILLRTGLIGIAFYLVLWIYLLKSYMFSHPHVFAGLLGVFLYGFFHETTKLTYVALLFFILLNYAFERRHFGEPKHYSLDTRDVEFA